MREDDGDNNYGRGEQAIYIIVVELDGLASHHIHSLDVERVESGGAWPPSRVGASLSMEIRCLVTVSSGGGS